MRHASLFSGIGGFDLAAQWMGWTNVFAVEKDPDCRQVLKKNFSDIKLYEDIKEFSGEKYKGTIDIISGGFPCQPFSVAGKQRSKKDDRYLWPEMLRVIREIKPTWVVGENVPGIISLALDQVLSDLEGEGYTCQSFIIPACAVNAVHRRDRVWILAHNADSRIKKMRERSIGSIPSDSDGGQSWIETEREGGQDTGRGSEKTPPNSQHDGLSNRLETKQRAFGESKKRRMFESKGEDPWITGDSNIDEHRTDSGKNSEENQISGEYREKIILSGESCETDSNASNSNTRGYGRYQRQSSKERSTTCSSESSSQGKRRSRHKIKFPTSQPTVRRGNDGVSYRLDDGQNISAKARNNALKQLGNAVVPQLVYEIFKMIEKFNKGELKEWK